MSFTLLEMLIWGLICFLVGCVFVFQIMWEAYDFYRKEPKGETQNSDGNRGEK